MIFSHFCNKRSKLFLSFCHLLCTNQHDFHSSATFIYLTNTSVEIWLGKFQLVLWWGWTLDTRYTCYAHFAHITRFAHSLFTHLKNTMPTLNWLCLKYSLCLHPYTNENFDFWAISTHCAISNWISFQFWCLMSLFVINTVEFIFWFLKYIKAGVLNTFVFWKFT